MFERLAETMKVGSMELKGRLVMPSMGSHYTDVNHHFTEQGAYYYGARAKGGFSLLMTEYICISKEGLSNPKQAAIYDDCFIPTLKRVTDEVHKEGGRIFAQLQHSGNQSDRKAAGMEAVSASAIPALNNKLPVRALTTEEVWGLVEKHAQAALRAKNAGFDGVEVHGAHGYLVAQFLSKACNKRTDLFGGNVSDRARFACEIIKRIKEVCGKEYPVSIRISADEAVEVGNEVQDACAQAPLFEQAGADLLNVSFGSTWSKSAVQPYMTEPGFNMDRVSKVKKCVSIPVIGNGRINDPALAESCITSGSMDLVALGRQSICDPEFPKKVHEGRTDEIFTCTGCMQRCYYSTSYENPEDGVSCMINPFSGREKKWVIGSADKSKKITIIGGGPAGLMAAWVLGQRGHKVSVYDRNEQPGGQYRLAAVPPHKQDLTKTIQTYVALGTKAGVEYHYNTDITEEYFKNCDSHVVILASGSVPVVPPIKGIEQEYIVKANDVLEGEVILTGKKVLVVGAGLVGVETAEYLLQYDNQVDLVDMIKEPAPLLGSAPRKRVMAELDRKHVTFFGESKVLEFTEDGLICEKNGEAKRLSGYEAVVLAFGSRSNQELLEAVERFGQQEGKQVYTIGDAQKAGDAKKAIYEAAVTALGI